MARGNPASLKPASPRGEVALAKNPLCVKLDPDIDALIRALPVAERSVWMRRVLSEAARQELAPELDSDERIE